MHLDILSVQSLPARAGTKLAVGHEVLQTTSFSPPRLLLQSYGGPAALCKSKCSIQRGPTALKLSKNRTSRFISCKLRNPSIPRSALSCVRSRPMVWSTPASRPKAEA